jgi:hypothetical protein
MVIRYRSSLGSGKYGMIGVRADRAKEPMEEGGGGGCFEDTYEILHTT